MSTTVQAFDAFLSDITATDYQRKVFIPNRKASVEENLTAGFNSTCDMPFSVGYLIGSASKNTIVRPLDDIDVLAVFTDAGAASRYRWNSRDFLYRVRNAYAGFETQQVGARGQAVRVFFKTGGFVDVAPVFEVSANVFDLPAGDGTWVKTSPLVANIWFSNKNSSLSYNLAPVVRLLKKWNSSHSKRLRSFHLETMAGNLFGSMNSNYRDALRLFFQHAAAYLDCYDPGSQSGSLSGYLSYSQRTQVVESFTAAYGRCVDAIAAESRGDHDEAKRLWRIVLGSSFPSA